MTDTAIPDDMVQRACVALFELKSNVVGLTGSRKGKVTTETIVRTVLAAAFSQPRGEWPNCQCRTQCETC